MKTKLLLIAQVIILFVLSGGESILAHHYKGLPHYGYFENYPQTPIDEYLGQSGDYEFFLVIYDFQGLQREDKEDPDDARFFLNVYNMKENKAYTGPLSVTILDNNKPIYNTRFEKSEQESLYYFSKILSPEGDYSLDVKMVNTAVELPPGNIPFELSSQKTALGKWLGVILLLILGATAVGARKARINKDRSHTKKMQPSYSKTN